MNFLPGRWLIKNQIRPRSRRSVSCCSSTAASMLIALQVAAMKNLGYNIVYEDALSSVTPATVTPEIVRMEQAGVQSVAVTSINDTGVSRS